MTRPLRYIAYIRKSTDSEDRQVLSLDSQETELQKIAQRDGLHIVATLRESRSAKAEGRPVFGEMMRMLRDNEADAILCWKLDRLARNFADGGRIIDQLQRAGIKEIRTYDAVHLPSDNVLMMAVQLGMANQYIRDLSQNVKRGNRTKLEKGDWPNCAPFGYVNCDKKIHVEGTEAAYVRRAFELYGTGEYSLLQVADILHAEGLRTKTGKKVYRKTIHHWLGNAFYRGIMHRDGIAYQGNHTPLITAAQYERAQDVLHGRHHPKPEKHFYPARGFLTCDVCGCMFTADTKKGYQYYYCTNGKGRCDEHKAYLRGEYVDELLSRLFACLHFDEELIALLSDAYREKYGEREEYRRTAQTRIDGEIAAIGTKESLLTDTYLAGTISQSLYESKMRELGNQRTELCTQRHQLHSTPRRVATFEQIRTVFLDGNKAAHQYMASSPQEKRHIIGTVLSNARIRNKNVVQFQFKPAFAALAKAPKSGDFDVMRRGRDSNPRDSFTRLAR